MGVDIHIKLCKYNPADNLWHELKLYRKDKDKDEFKKVYLYEGRNSEMFAAMQNEEQEDYGHFPCADIPMLSLDEELREEVKEAKKYCYGFNEILLSDLKYYIKDYPTVVDYSEEGPMKVNPIKYLFESCYAYGEFAEGWSFGIEPLSRYKLLYWFDH